MAFRIQNTNVYAGERQIQSGLAYEKLFPKPQFKQVTLKPNGTIDQTVLSMGNEIKTYFTDTTQLAHVLKTPIRKETCRNIWRFVYQHIQ